MYDIRPTGKFDDDFKEAKAEYGLDLIEEIQVITRLLSTEDITPEILEAYSDHRLRGKWDDCQDIHVYGDLILVYKIEDNALKLVRLATHEELERWNY